MNKSSKILSEFLSDALPGDDLSAAVRAAIARAFSVIRSHAHRSAARRARGSELIERVRILIKANDAWETELSPIERNVIDVKFGGHLELSNTEVGEVLNLTKQMIAYHLKSIARKLEAEFGAAVVPEIPADITAAVSNNEAGLMNDDRWQAIVDWWHTRQTDEKEISKGDLEFLSELVSRLNAIESNVKTQTAAAATAGKPGRKLPPTRYQDLRLKLIKTPEFLEILTHGQKRAMRIGLALGESDLAPDAELGFRRFDESEKMTKQNFNYLVREVIKRLPE